MAYPNSRRFEFDIERVYTVRASEAGRPDLIAYDAYGSTIYYRVICEANGIRMPLNMRYGIRPANYMTSGITESDVESWDNYSNDGEGSVDSIKAGDKLILPSLENANEYLKRYVNDRNIL